MCFLDGYFMIHVMGGENSAIIVWSVTTQIFWSALPIVAQLLISSSFPCSQLIFKNVCMSKTHIKVSFIALLVFMSVFEVLLKFFQVTFKLFVTCVRFIFMSVLDLFLCR